MLALFLMLAQIGHPLTPNEEISLLVISGSIIPANDVETSPLLLQVCGLPTFQSYVVSSGVGGRAERGKNVRHTAVVTRVEAMEQHCSQAAGIHMRLFTFICLLGKSQGDSEADA